MQSTRKTKAICFLLCLILCFTLIPDMGFAQENQSSAEEPTQPEHVTKQDVITSELTEDETSYDLGDGKTMTVFHSSPVRYKNDNGALVDYDASLTSIPEGKKSEQKENLESYAYENKQGDHKQYLPESLSEETPILMESGKKQITFTPTDHTLESMNLDAKPVKVKEEVVPTIYEQEEKRPVNAVYGTTDAQAALTYTSSEFGVKEKLTLSEKPSTNVFEYKLNLKGMYPRKNVTTEGITFYDKKTDEICADIAPAWMNDASENAYSEDITYELTKQEGSEDAYLLTMTVDQAYLDDPSRQWPVTIDPTTTWLGSSKVKDAYIISGSKYGSTNFYESGTKVMPAGKNSTGTHRTLIKFVNLDTKLKNQSITSAKLTVYETGTGASKQKVTAKRIASNWALGSVTYNKQPSYGGAYDSITTKKTAHSAHAFNVTAFAKSLAAGTISNYGLLISNASTSYACFHGSRGTSYRPKLAVVHYSVPTTATSASVAPATIAAASTGKLTFAGISSTGLKNVQYRVAACNSAGTVTNASFLPYAASRVITTGSAIPSLKDGYYRIYIRGINKAGVAGGERVTNLFYVDKTLPTIAAISLQEEDGTDITGKWTENENPRVSFSNVTDASSAVATSGFSYAMVPAGKAPVASDFKAPASLNAGGTAKPYTGTFRLQASDQNAATGTYDIHFRVKDSAGNVATKKLIYKRDVSDPTGTITIKELGKTPEITAMKGTVDIDARMNGTGSELKSGSLKLYKKPAEGEAINDGDHVEIIFENLSTSRIEPFHTLDHQGKPKHENGDYMLKMDMEDQVGRKASITKNVRIENPINAPKVTTKVGRQNTFRLSWLFETEDEEEAQKVQGRIKEVQYQIENGAWESIPDSKDTEGAFEVALPEEKEAYTIGVRAMDEAGVPGKIAKVTCVLDNTPPQAEIASFHQGRVKGTIKDDHLESWKVYIKEKNAGDDTYKEVLSGTKSKDNEELGFIDLSAETYVPGETYLLKLEGVDIGENTAADTFEVVKPLDGSEASRMEAQFRVKRPGKQGYAEPVFQIGAKTQELGLLPQDDLSLSADSYTWYIQNEKAGQGQSFAGDFDTTKENATYQEDTPYPITVVGKADGQLAYSTAVIKNSELTTVSFPEEAVSGTTYQKEVSLPAGTVSFRLADVGAGASYYALLGSKKEALTPNKTYHVADLSDTQVSVDGITIEAETDGNAPREVTLQLDTAEGEYFQISKLEDYLPETLSAKDKINYKTYIKWENKITEDTPANISYELHRSTEKGFVPTSETLAASDLRAGYFSEVNVNYGKEFYYKVCVVEKNGETERRSSYSAEVSSRVVDQNEYAKRMGKKEYWEYAEFETPVGNGAIEKSQGNLVYTQTDAELPNEQLQVELSRTYNSQSSAKSAFGIGWNHNFDMELLQVCEKDSLDFDRIVFKDETGTIHHFKRDEEDEDGKYISSMGKYITLQKTAKEQTEELEIPERSIGTVADADKKKTISLQYSYVMKNKDNLEYRFNSGGQLVYVGEPNGNFLFFAYEPDTGLLSKAITSKNISMSFAYNDESGKDPLTVKEVKLPDGSVREYKYNGDDRLDKVIARKGSESITYAYGYEYDGLSGIFAGDKAKTGRLTDIYDGAGSKYQVEYGEKNDEDKVVRMNYPLEEGIQLTYSKDGSLTKTEKLAQNDPISAEQDWFATHSGNCTKSRDAEGIETTYTYRDELLETTTTQVTGQYLDEAQMVRDYDPESKTERTEYDEATDDPTKEVEEDGSVTTTTYYGPDAGAILEGLPKTEIAKDGEGKIVSHETYEYDQDGNETSVYDSITGTTTLTDYYKEDGNGHLKGEVKEEIEILGQEGDTPESKTTYEYSYDNDGNKTEKTIETVKEPGKAAYTIQTETVYDVLGQEISSVDSRGKIDTHTYDGFGRLISSTYKEKDDAGNEIETQTTQTYDANGALVKETAEDGTVTEYAYDKMNRVVSTTVTKGGQTKTWTTEYSHGSVDIYTGKGAGATKRIDHALITTEKDPDGYVMSQTYQDKLGRTVREKVEGIYIDTTYDDQGNVLTEFVIGQNDQPGQGSPAEGGKLTLSLYDKAGNQTHTIQNPTYNESEGTFCADEDAITTSSTFDKSGNVLTETDGEGYTTAFTYDAEGNITSVTLPDETVTNYQYDRKNDDGSTSDITIDALGRESEVRKNQSDLDIAVLDKGKTGTTPISTTYKYDSKENMTEEKHGLDNRKTYEYDAKDRVTTVHYFDKAGDETLCTKYSYDRADNITLMRDYNVSASGAVLYRYTKYEYDFLKRMVGFAECDGPNEPTTVELDQAMIRYEYDISDNLIGIDYPQTNKKVKGLRFIYNQDKWLTEIKAKTESGTKALREYEYTKSGKVKSIKDYRNFLENNSDYTLRSHTYDTFERPVKIEYRDSSDLNTVKESYSYTYDKNNLITSETLKNNYPVAEEDKQDQVREYQYDKVGRLIQTDITDHIKDSMDSISYKYDKVGNRVKETKNDRETSYVYNDLNQLVSSEEKAVPGEPGGEEEEDPDPPVNKTYSYDANGNQLTEVNSATNERKEFTYDAADQLSRYVSKVGGAIELTQTNVYNGDGKRIQKTEADATTRYYYDGDSILYTADAAKKITALNLMGLEDNVIASARDGSEGAEPYYFYNKDIRSSVTGLLSKSGESVVSYEYDDFGETKIKGDAEFYNELCYTEGIYDQSTGLYYLNARYYNPEDARFLNQDTYRGETDDPGSQHLYAYCKNSPVTYSDPSGQWIWAAAGAAWGAYDGYKYAKKKKLRGWRKAGAIIGGAALGVLPIHKIHKVGKAFKAGRKVYRSFKSSKKIRRITRRARASVKVLRKNISRIKKPSRVRAVIRKVKQKVSRPQCFTAGTLISTSAGLKPIEQIKKGDYVWAEDPNTGAVAKKEVQQTFVNETNLLTKLVVDDEIIETTEEHPFWVENQGWLPARELKKGDLVRLQSGKVLPVEKVETLVLKEPIKVYNFQVEDYHTYYVSDEQVLVHNSCRGKNKLQPDPRAKGAHSVIKRDSTGRITNYETYKVDKHHPSGFRRVKRYDAIGKPHADSRTGRRIIPHVHVFGKRKKHNVVRPPRRWEIPK